MSSEEARKHAAEFERLWCHGDIAISDISREDIEEWAWKAYGILWRLGQPESAREAGKKAV